MSKESKKTLVNIISMFLMTALFVFGVVLVWNTLHIALSISLVIIAVLFLVIGNIARLKGYDSIYKLALISIYIGVIMLIIYDILVFTGFWGRFDSYEELKKFINNTGGKSELLYILAQFLQVTFIPIPSNLVVMIGDELFGPLKAFYLSMIGLFLGSMFAFFLGKQFGMKLVIWIAGKEAIDKYQQLVKGRDKTLLVLMFIFPMFPDDLLCMVAGLTSMSYFTFTLVMLISRPLAIAGTILFRRGLLDFIPFNGWGIPVWFLIIFTLIMLFIYIFKNGDKIESWMLKVMGKVMKKNFLAELYPLEIREKYSKDFEAAEVVLYDEANEMDKYK